MRASVEEPVISETPDAAQQEFPDWSNEMGERWLAHLDQFEGMIAGVGEALLDFAAFKPNERVVDVGCGAGPSTLDIARRLGPEGFVLGLDVSPALVGAANERAEAEDHNRIAFRLADAAVDTPPEAPFDVLFSRFGLMFFEDPGAAFAHMRGWLRPGGRLAMSCWAPPRENPWIMAVQGVLKRHFEMPERDPTLPGPFALADTDRLTRILTGAGFTNVAIEPWRGRQPVGGPGSTPATATDFAIEGMSIGTLLEEQPDEVVAQIRGEIEAAFAPGAGPGGVMMEGAAWFVSAKNP
ncbi:MAG: methyltransferase domain-containing protein [Maricaulaceae bacterium]